MWTLIVAAAILAGTYVYHRWIEDHPGPPRPADISVPRVDEGAPIPLVYGRCRVRSPVLAWSGNLHQPPAAGGDYNLNMLFVVGIPFYGGLTTLGSTVVGPIGFNGVGGMYTGDLLGYGFSGLIEAHTVDHATYVNNDGGGGSGAGVVAAFYPGSPYQDVGELLNPSGGITARDNMIDGGVSPSLIPGYRNQIIFFGEFNIGPNPSPPAFGFEVTSLSTGTTAFMGQSLLYDADPAAVLYDLITSPWGKLGLPVDIIDMPSFRASSLTLCNEGHGYSRSFEGTFDASEAIRDILQQTDGTLYQEPTTGKLVYKLVRNDYVVTNLEDINPGNVIAENGKAEISYAIQGWNETFNQVRLTFTDRQFFDGNPTQAGIYTDGLALAQNGANAFSQGRLRSIDVRYMGCCSRALAQKLASRELAVVSRPMVKATITVNRTFNAHRPGDVVTWTWPELAIDHMIMRIARVNFGQLHDGAITLDLIRDAFDASLGAFPIP
jgi:hypothetical protein